MKNTIDPVLVNLSKGQLKATMPVRGKIDRTDYAHLQALGRVLVGIAPWLESSPKSEAEEKERFKFATLG